MCGIAGIIQSSPERNDDNKLLLKKSIQQMTDALAHRGPDGEGHWINEKANAALGHRRLSIIDLSDAGSQPMHYLNRYTIIHNGEIYNYIELREELQKNGYSFHSKTDTEVIAAAYDYWQDECVEHFDGMFSFAIWDSEDEVLFAARDRFGEKPFFYHYQDSIFTFASEMKGLWAAGIERTSNLKLLFNFITIGYTDNPDKPEETFYENIFKLPPAHRLNFYAHQNELSIDQYWEVDAEIINDKISDKDAVEQFNYLLQASVKKRLRSDVAIGSSLSGGLDSSSIVSLINPLTSFTAVFPGFERDEFKYAKLIAEKFNLQQYTTEVNESDIVNDFEKLCYHQEEPFGSASIMAQYKVYGLAKQHNIKVLLDGQGADEILAGYPKYYKWYWQELFRKLKLFRSGELKAAHQLGINEKFGFKNAIAAWFPDFASIVLERQYLLNALRQPDLSKEFVQLQSKEAYYTTPAHYNLNGVLRFNTFTHGLEELLRYADRNSMAHGREVRLPFLSHELVEFLFALPSKFKIRKGRTKWLLRESMKEKLPAEIVWRTDKVGFEPPQKKWMQHSVVQQMIQDAKAKLVEQRILKPEVLNKKIQPHDAHAAESFDWRYLSAASLFNK
ncbi:MAG: asparagine synthase (glutamine-hydrolyzing) [Bacteroidetes bacterium]|nr:MAG: asparagine synthase (glutamine-hydrolyzing) [Bacteroidota bacterium]